MAPRGAQQKRGQNVMRRNRMAAKRRAVACSEPRRSLVNLAEEAEAPSLRAKAAGIAARSTRAISSSGVAGPARRDRNALNAGDLARGRSRATDGPRPRAEASRSGEESDESIVPTKAVKVAGGKGLCSMVRPQQERERRLWRH